MDSYIANTLYLWSNLRNYEPEKALFLFDKLDNRFENLKKIQNTFINCFFETNKTSFYFEQLTSDQNTDFSRYNYFYINYLNSIDDYNKLKDHDFSLKKYPRNLLLPAKVDLDNLKYL